jgi:hypothetical protein
MKRPTTAFCASTLPSQSLLAELKQHYVDKGPGIKPIRPELAATLSDLASGNAMFFADTAQP